METIIIAGEKYEISKNSHKFLEKYLQKMKSFIENNNIEIEVYDDIEERISEKFDEFLASKNVKEISDKIIIDIVNEIGEPNEIFKELIEEEKEKVKEKKINFKEYFSNKNTEITRNSEKGILFGVCYGIGKKYQIDPLWIRLGFIFGTFLWGMTIVLYIALVFLLPNKKLKKKDDDNLIDEVHDVANNFIEKVKKTTKKINDEDGIREGKSVSKSLNVENTLEKKEYIIKDEKSNIFVRLIKSIVDFIKSIFIFVFHSSRIFIAILLFIISVPVLLSLLFVSGFSFTNFIFDNQSLFSNFHIFLKIGIVGIIFSLFFFLIGLTLKLLKGKLFSNILLLTGLVGTIIFIFIGSIGFFNTFNSYTNIFTKTEVFEFDSKEVILDNLDLFGSNSSVINGINWIQNISFKKIEGKKLKIEVKSFINAKNNTEADKIFSQLTPLNLTISPNLNFGLENKNSFISIVPFSFLRREVIIYIPENITFKIGDIFGENINNISNLYYKENDDFQRVYRINSECRNSLLKYNTDKGGFVCEK